MTASLWIVRHGNTFEAGEPPRRIGSRTDSPLTDAGRAQARALRDHFRAGGIRFDRIIAAPLTRTRETAAIIADGPVEAAGWLAEIDHGPDEGAQEADVVGRLGAPALAEWDRSALAPPGWIVDTERRLADWRAAIAQARGQMLLVTSNGAARFAPLAIGANVPLRLRTGAWGRIDVDARASLVEWDRRP